VLVVDASAIADLLLQRPAAAAISKRLAEHAFDLHAPQLLDVEVLSVLGRLAGSGDASPERAAEAVADLMDVPIERYGHEVLVPRIWELRSNFSAHDATYVALAEALGPGAPALLTTDGRLARAVRERGTIAVVHAA
jgi:predicted nucleic acid-binding protein